LERRAAPRNPQVETSLRTGVLTIDREHQGLLLQLDRLQSDPSIQPDSEIFSEYLMRLGREINAHFDSEERILRSCEMPEALLQEHIRAHSRILEQYSNLNLGLMVGQKVSREEIVGLIRQWIVEHVLHHDLKAVDYLPDDHGH